MIFGALTKHSLKAIRDLEPREVLVLAPLVVLTILFGVYPAPILDTSAAAVGLLVQNLADVFGGAASVPAAVVAH